MERSRLEADRAYRHFSGRDEQWAWKFRLLEANVLIWQGLSQPALSLIHSDLPRQFLGGDLAIQKQMLTALAHLRLGNMQAADQHLSEAEQLCASTKSVWKGEVVGVRGVFEVAKGDLPTARNLFRESLNSARERGDRFLEATALLNLGRVALGEEHFDESIDWSTEAHQTSESISSKPILEKALGNLAWAYYKMGDFERSLSLYLEASHRAHEIDMTFDEIRWVNNAGLIYYEKQQYSLARANYERALKLAEGIENQEQVMSGLVFLSYVAAETGHLDEAAGFVKRAIDLAHARRDHSAELSALLVQARIDAQSHLLDKAEATFKRIILESTEDASLRWQAQNNLALLYEQRNQVKEADGQFRNATGTLECARNSLHHEEFRLPFLANASHIYDDYIRFLVEQGRTDEALQAADYSRAQTLSEGLGLLKKETNCAARPKSSLSPEQAARVAGGTALFYWLGERQSYLWVATAKNTSLIKLPPAAEINSLVQNYRQALLESRDVLESGNQDGVKLYETLVAPAQKYIFANSRVTIIADGSLNNLNFETLIVPKPKPHYWIEDVNLSNASSLRMLASSTTAMRVGGKLLLIGDPVVPDPKFPPLPSAKIEMQDIETHFAAENIDVLSGPEANPIAFFKSKPESFSYLHFVAHGTASQFSPLDSAVILSKATPEEDSYKLHARDIIGHRLHANLVVISTCYGSGSTLYNGEGLVGLSWAFLRAGAHNVVGALWAVSDTSTAQLMDKLYAGISQGHNPEDALRNAKLSLLHSDGPFRKPIYWAPFQLYTGP